MGWYQSLKNPMWSVIVGSLLTRNGWRMGATNCGWCKEVILMHRYNITTFLGREVYKGCWSATSIGGGRAPEVYLDTVREFIRPRVITY